MSTTKFYEVQTTRNTMTLAFMEFKDARECAHVIYNKLGYANSIEFIAMLSGYDLVTLEDRTNLTTFITMLEEDKIYQKQQRKLHNKIMKKT